MPRAARRDRDGRFQLAGLHRRGSGCHADEMNFERITGGRGQPRPGDLAFSRHELSLILDVYGRMVALGEWHDYAIDHGRERAVFSIFRGAAHHPVYRVEKRRAGPPQARYAVVGMDGRIHRQGADLRRVLGVLDRKAIRPVD